MSRLEFVSFVVGFLIATFALIVVLGLDPANPLPSEWF